MSGAPRVGDLRVWWIPQIPMEPFQVPVDSVEEAARIVDLLASYDAFQFAKRIKPDYSNAGGLEIYAADSDGEGRPGWENWFSADDDDFDEYRRERLAIPDYWSWRTR